MPRVRAASGRPRPPRARARDPRRGGTSEGIFDRLREQNRGGAALELHRRPDHGEQPDGRPPRLGPHAQGRLPALQGAARLRPALPERLRLPGPLGRGRGREGSSASTRSARSRSTGSPSSRTRCKERVAAYAEVITEQSKRLGMWMDWDNDYYTFSRHEHRVHLALPEDRPRARLALQGPPLDRVVPALRDVALAARADRRAYEELAAPVALRPLPADRARGRVARRLDDDAVDAAGERRRGGASPTRSTACSRTASGSRVSASTTPAGDETVVETRARRGARRARVRGPVRRPRRRSAASSTASSRGTRSRSTKGTGIVHIAPGCGAEDFELSRVHDLPVLVADRRVRPLLRRLRRGSTAARRPRRPSTIIEELGERGCSSTRARSTHRYPICWRCKTPLVFRVVDDWFISVRRDPAADARRERDRRVDARLLLEADGRLAAQHGRLEHLAQALLRAAAAVLSVRGVRAS